MKAIILLFLIGFSLTYNTADAVRYARTYCKSHAPPYGVYEPEDKEGAIFISQCMIAGGMDFQSCSVSWRDNHGYLQRVKDLKSCLTQKGWKHSTTRPASFKAGYPIFSTSYSHAMIATAIDGKGVRYCSHNNDRCDAIIYDGIEYYYE